MNFGISETMSLLTELTDFQILKYSSGLGRQEWTENLSDFCKMCRKIFQCWGHRGTFGAVSRRKGAEQRQCSPSLSPAHTASELQQLCPGAAHLRGSTTQSPVQGCRRTHLLQLSGNSWSLTGLRPDHSCDNCHCLFSSTSNVRI